jgi:hypothetical protein
VRIVLTLMRDNLIVAAESSACAEPVFQHKFKLSFPEISHQFVTLLEAFHANR